MASVTNINEVLDGHVGLEVECVDRLYLNAYVPNLQVAGQVVRFLTGHRGCPVPSPALFEQIGRPFMGHLWGIHHRPAWSTAVRWRPAAREKRWSGYDRRLSRV